MISQPIFIFYKDQMVVTDKTEMHRRLEAEFLKDMVVFDASGRRLTAKVSGDSVVFREESSPQNHDAELKQRMAQFWIASGNPIAGMEKMGLGEAVEKTVRRLKEMEWKTYRRGGRLFWTLMWPAALIPFMIGFFKLPMDAKTLYIYSGCFVAAMLVIAVLRRILYHKPPFPDPGKSP